MALVPDGHMTLLTQISSGGGEQPSHDAIALSFALFLDHYNLSYYLCAHAKRMIREGKAELP